MIELTGDPKRDKEIIGFSERRGAWSAANRGVRDILDEFRINATPAPEDFEELEDLKKKLARLENLMQKNSK
jgi:hypothetical protein